LRESFPGELLQLLREVGEAVAHRGEGIYLVGGGVRDLLLGRPNLDLDLVIEGPAIPLAQELARSKGWKVVTYPQFGTAKISWGDFHLDLATARGETYPHPGALPQVRPGTLRDDLFRRDFTINALAIDLAPNRFGELLDFYGGLKDLERGRLRVLHERSFIDDPTRILRGIRYEQRLGFSFEPKTEELARRDGQVLEKISGERLWHELELILREESPEKALLRAAELGVLPHLRLKFSEMLAGKFQEARLRGRADPMVYLGLLAGELNEEEVESFIQRLKPPGWARQVMKEVVRLRPSLPALAQATRPSEAYRQLEGYYEEALEAAALLSGEGKAEQWLRLYLEKLRFIKPELTGEDLKQMGVPPGRRLGQLLARLHEARLDGEVGSREEEVELVQKLLGEP